MNRMFYTTCLSLVLSAVSLSAVAQSELQWQDGRVHDFGAIAEDDGPVSHRFVVRNAGHEPFTILGSSATCGCTTASHTAGTVAPGDTASVSVEFNPHGRRGRFHQRVAVTTSSASKINYLFVKGSVIASRRHMLEEYPFAWGKMRLAEDSVAVYVRTGGERAAVCLRGINDSPSAITPRATHLPDGMGIEVVPDKVDSGDPFSLLLSCSMERLRTALETGDSVLTVCSDAGESAGMSLPVKIVVMD